MKPGPAPRPSALQALSGRAHKARNRREARGRRPATIPYAPKHLCAPARAEWRRLIGWLVEVGLYTEADQAALELYCQAYGRWREAEAALDAIEEGPIQHGERGDTVSAWQRVANARFDQARRLLAEFGLTPAQRSRVVAAMPEEPDELEQLFARRSEARPSRDEVRDRLRAANE